MIPRACRYKGISYICLNYGNTIKERFERTHETGHIILEHMNSEIPEKLQEDETNYFTEKITGINMEEYLVERKIYSVNLWLNRYLMKLMRHEGISPTWENLNRLIKIHDSVIFYMHIKDYLVD